MHYYIFRKAYIFDNKKNNVNKKVWARLAEKYSSERAELLDAVLGGDGENTLTDCIHDLKEGDILIGDGNREGDDNLDEKLLSSIQNHTNNHNHFFFVSADRDRVQKFQEAIRNTPLMDYVHLCVSRELRETLEESIAAEGKKESKVLKGNSQDENCPPEGDICQGFLLRR